MIAPDDCEAGQSVGVVIPCYGQAHFLADALSSCLGQTVAPARIVVIDDGSSDNPGEVVSRFPGVEIVHQVNAGLPAARNAGLALLDTAYCIFLDADDTLEPAAIEVALAAMRANPGAGLVYGAHKFVDRELVPRGDPVCDRIGPLAYHAFLEGNCIGCPGAALFDRAKLVECGRFNPRLKRCEDLDAYLRIARRFRIVAHGHHVVNYRQHSGNMSHDAETMQFWHRAVLEANRPEPDDEAALACWRRGMASLAWHTANRNWSDRGQRPVKGVIRGWQMMKRSTYVSGAAAVRQMAIRAMPISLANALRRLRRKWRRGLATNIDFGDLLRVAPISALLQSAPSSGLIAERRSIVSTSRAFWPVIPRTSPEPFSNSAMPPIRAPMAGTSPGRR